MESKIPKKDTVKKTKSREKSAKKNAGVDKTTKAKTKRKSNAKSSPKSEKQTKKRTRHQNTRTNKVPIVAIGASAGGLEPFEQIFDGTAAHTGVAYIVIQHLSPDFQSMMGELLSRHSSMAIKQVIDGLKIEPDTIYLNPPRTEMTLKRGKFKTEVVDTKHQLSLPIDTFFTSLADEYGEKAIAVVLSGTGSDGTKGCKKIKTAGGVVLIQEPKSAKFDGMPISAINSGLADAVAVPGELPELIQLALEGKPLPVPEVPVMLSENPHDTIYNLLDARFGTDFHHYKVATMHRRIDRRAAMNNIDLEQFALRLQSDPDELDQMYADLLIDVTAFFRDKEAFAELADTVVPELAKKMSAESPVRIWVPGCASGEEAYSIALCFAEYARINNIALHIKILATDIHKRSITSASAGYYPENILGEMDPEIRERYFDKDGNFYQVKQEIRRCVVFSQQNLLKDPPFTRIDLVSCRNLLIYMNDAAQQKIILFFHFSLKPDGYMFLGPSESLGSSEKEFRKLSVKWRIFQKLRDVRLLDPTALLSNPPSVVEAVVDHSMRTGRKTTALHSQTSSNPPNKRAYNSALNQLLKAFAPAGFLLTRNGEIEHVFGDAGTRLSQQTGSFSNRVVDLIEPDLKVVVSTGLERMRSSDKLDFERRVLVTDTTTDQPVSVTIKINPLPEIDGTVNYFLLLLEEAVIETEISKPVGKKKPAVALVNSETTAILQQRIEDLNTDLQVTEESLQSAIEELETSNEELQATNEELTASNEELQSTNEELHSVNEELFTVSSEHQLKIDELTLITNDMDHLLRATSIGIIFLDHELNVRRFTPMAAGIFNIVPQDLGRPISHITYQFDEPNLLDLILGVKNTGKVHEQEIQNDDAPIMLRILPDTNTLENEVGVVITLIDISELKAIQNQQIREAKRHEEVFADIEERVIRWCRDTHSISYVNPAYAQSLQSTPKHMLGQDMVQIHESVHADENELNEFQRYLGELSEELQLGDLSARVDESLDSDNKERVILWRTRAIKNQIPGKPDELQATGINITETHRYNKALEKLIELTSSLSGSSDSSDDILQKILQCGCQYLQTENGRVGRLDGEKIINLAGYGKFTESLNVGDLMPFASEFLLANTEGIEKIVAFDNLNKETDPDQVKIIKRSGFGSYIGIRVRDERGATWAVGFASSLSRKEKFSSLERNFIGLLGRFTSFMLERRYYLNSLITNQRELEIVNNNLSQFSYVASHDLQEPLRKIRQFGELLTEEHRDQLTGEAPHFINVMTGAAERMNTLIKDLLAFSKASNKDLKLKDQDLSKVLAQAQQELESQIDEVSAVIETERLPVAECDETLVKQLFFNLLSNSLKYRRESVPPRISIKSIEQDEGYLISVTDNGIGIDKNTKQDIFQAFTRLHSRDEYDGSGIGLAACRMTCERHGWEISLDDSFDQGSKFTVHIPK